MRRTNKRGSMQDVFFLGFILFASALMFVMGYVMVAKVNDNLQADDNIATQGKTIMNDSKNNFVGWFDNIFLVVFVALWIAALVLAFQIPSHIVFFFLSLIVYIVLIFVTSIFGNTYYDFSIAAGISTYAADFTIIPFVMNNFARIMLFVGFSVGVVMYSRANQQ